MEIIQGFEFKKVPTVTYVAFDGKTFSNESACRNYEQQLEIENHRLFKNRIDDVCTYWDEHKAELFYIVDAEDIEILKFARRITKNFECDFCFFGPGWYIYYTEDWGDMGEKYYLKNYTNYEKTAKQEFENWKSSIRSKIGWEAD